MYVCYLYAILCFFVKNILLLHKFPSSKWSQMTDMIILHLRIFIMCHHIALNFDFSYPFLNLTVVFVYINVKDFIGTYTSQVAFECRSSR